MNTISKSPEMWLRFDFPIGCDLTPWWKNFYKKAAAKSPGGGCCPYYFCLSGKQGAPCDLKTAEICAERCEKFYEKYIKGGEE